MTSTRPLAGKPVPAHLLTNIARLISAYYELQPDPGEASQLVAFGTSGHRGVSFDATFNQHHVLAITQAVCEQRSQRGISGPLFLGLDTHALSEPAYASALEVLAANGATVLLAEGDEYTPTPALSHAILSHNRGRSAGFADGIVITPSHNPPDAGGFKYNPPHGGPADTDVTRAIAERANALLREGLHGVKRMPYERALHAATTHRHDFIGRYVSDLPHVVDMEVIQGASLELGVDPLGGAGLRYWQRIAEQFRLNLTVVNTAIDPTFRFMTLDWDERVRMDPSSPDAMQGLIGLKDRFDIAFACDPDHDRHGIVTPAGLMPPNHYLAVAADYLFRHRPQWGAPVAIGKTVVSSTMIDHVAQALGRRLYEVPVGFKWFVEGLQQGRLGFAGEESAGASFLRRDGSVWTTDKDGIIPALLAAEMTARTGLDPAMRYRELEQQHGVLHAQRVDAPAGAAQKAALSKLSPQAVHGKTLAGEPIREALSHAPGNGEGIGGIKIISEHAWFAARPSGTEDIYKIYAESALDAAHLQRTLEDAQRIVDDVLR